MCLQDLDTEMIISFSFPYHALVKRLDKNDSFELLRVCRLI